MSPAVPSLNSGPWALGMIGSSEAGSWIARTAFVVLTVWVLMSGELRAKSATVLVLIWLVGFIDRDPVPHGVALFPSGVDVVNRPADFQVPQDQFTATSARSLKLPAFGSTGVDEIRTLVQRGA